MWGLGVICRRHAVGCRLPVGVGFVNHQPRGCGGRLRIVLWENTGQVFVISLLYSDNVGGMVCPLLNVGLVTGVGRRIGV